MARKTRIHLPGSFVHVIGRGNGRRDLFTNDAIRQHFLQLWLIGAAKFDSLLHAYCLMTNHYHFLVEVGSAKLGKIMHYVQFRFAQYLHNLSGTDGHVFQDRHKQFLCRSDAHLLKVLRYIHRNPVKHGIVKDPGDWPWSSHKAYLGEPSPLVKTDYLLGFFGVGRDTREAYRRFMGAKASTPWPHDEPWSWSEQELVPKVEPMSERRTTPDTTTLLRALAAKHGTTLAKLAGGDNSRQIRLLRRFVAYEARAAGVAIADIARGLNRAKSTVHEILATFQPERNPNEGTVPIDIAPPTLGDSRPIQDLGPRS